MGSELVSFGALPLPEGVRGGRVGIGAEEGLRGVADAGGAIVSCSALKSFESMVGAAFRSRAPPQDEQKRPVEETCAPQEEQYMGGEILPLGEGSLRIDAKAPCENYEMRSTWTAVPYASTSVTPCMTSVAS
jgi:hypothetical protein